MHSCGSENYLDLTTRKRVKNSYYNFLQCLFSVTDAKALKYSNAAHYFTLFIYTYILVYSSLSLLLTIVPLVFLSARLVLGQHRKLFFASPQSVDKTKKKCNQQQKKLSKEQQQ